MHYYQHHIGDFIRDTSRLTDAQCMAYLRMIWLYYDTEAPLPDAPPVIAMKIGADVAMVQQILDAFFRLTDDGWRHTRCDAEIAEYRALRERNQTNGKAGGRPRKPSGFPAGSDWQPNGNPTATDTEPSGNPNHKPVTNNHKEKNNGNRGSRLPNDSVLADDWERFCKTERPDLDPLKTFDSFKDYWTAQPSSKGVKLDWFATWRNWVRNTKQATAKQPSQTVERPFI